MLANLENSAMATELEKVSFHSNPKERQCQRMCTLPYSCAHFHMLARLCSKSFKIDFNSMWTKNFQMLQAGFWSSRGTSIKLPTFVESWRTQWSSRKTSISASLTTRKPFTVWITTNCEKFMKRWEYHTTLPASWEICSQVKKQQLEPHMEQLTGSELRKESDRAVYCHPVYLTSVSSTSCKMLVWMNHKLESRLLGEISTTSDMQMTPL